MDASTSEPYAVRAITIFGLRSIEGEKRGAAIPSAFFGRDVAAAMGCGIRSSPGHSPGGSGTEAIGPAAAAGILLADNTGHLRVIGASTEQIQLLELFQVQNDEGPCSDCFNTGKVVLNAEHSGVDMNDAFARLRAFAKNHDRHVTDVVEALAAGVVTIDSLTHSWRPPTPAAAGPRPDLPLTTVDADVPVFSVSNSEESGRRVVHVSGELDVDTRDRCSDARLGHDQVDVVVEMAALTFIDCSGYAGLIAAGNALRERRGSLTFRHASGQPARLLSLLGTLDRAH